MKQSYQACLELAKESGMVKSIAFCGISTGVYGFPAEEAAGIALEAVAEWTDKNPDVIDHIIFNTYGKQPTDLYNRLLKEWR